MDFFIIYLKKYIIMNFINHVFDTEEVCRIFVLKMFNNTWSMINKIIDNAEKDIIKGNYEKDRRQMLIQLVQTRINVFLNKLNESMFIFNYQFNYNISIPIESFDLDEKYDFLLNLDNTNVCTDINSID